MTPTVISDPYKFNDKYDAAQAFTDHIVDDMGVMPRNFWTGTMDSEVYFVYDLGCEAKITELHLRNSHNGKKANK